MTKRFSSLNWRDALYNSVRQAPGGINDAAAFLTERRNTSIHPESLRRKLTGGEQLDLDMAFLLTEWLQAFVCSHSTAKDWLIAANEQLGLSVVEMPTEPVGGFDDEADALNRKGLKAISELGEMCSAITSTTADGRVTEEERELVVAKARVLIVLCFRVIRNVTRWRVKEIGRHG
ncbi:hypothetical protein GGR41_000535 [Paenalcaligenes hominis]|uniref:Uncharacterized protein n=1 Tax=Paenalcaligenes hominis TaxID=643674 RepID=A0ABX0WM53_9BURK|nr:hypothetical protein [Paenalcaligenes hominis]NJB64314.1 hypothetical protein [Paenalcaligenes hominis]GGE68606.1 hypothetical protein GCM10007278_15860 [Paenalcaligenes hominis]